MCVGRTPLVTPLFALFHKAKQQGDDRQETEDPEMVLLEDHGQKRFAVDGGHFADRHEAQSTRDDEGASEEPDEQVGDEGAFVVGFFVCDAGEAENENRQAEQQASDLIGAEYGEF